MTAAGWTAVAIGIAAALVAAGAIACTPAEITRTEVYAGEQCVKSYADPDRNPQTVGAGPAHDLGGGVVRQVISTGVCGMGESIVVYFDCAAGSGAWLGGKNQPVPELQPKSTDGRFVPPVVEGSVAEDFIRTQEARFAPRHDPQAILAAARGLRWVAQSGALSQNRIAVEGRNFDMACGCKLFYPDGVR